MLSHTQNSIQELNNWQVVFFIKMNTLFNLSSPEVHGNICTKMYILEVLQALEGKS